MLELILGTFCFVLFCVGSCAWFDWICIIVLSVSILNRIPYGCSSQVF
jgi:hypothetical protein